MRPEDRPAQTPREAIIAWLESQGFILDGRDWGIAWSCRSGYDFIDLEFQPIDRWDGDQGWSVVVGHHASGTNPRMGIGVCDTMADVAMVVNTIRLINGFPTPEDAAERVRRRTAAT